MQLFPQRQSLPAIDTATQSGSCAGNLAIYGNGPSRNLDNRFDALRNPRWCLGMRSLKGDLNLLLGEPHSVPKHISERSSPTSRTFVLGLLSDKYWSIARRNAAAVGSDSLASGARAFMTICSSFGSTGALFHSVWGFYRQSVRALPPLLAFLTKVWRQRRLATACIQLRTRPRVDPCFR